MCNVAVDPHLTAVEHHHHHSGASTTMHAITLSFFLFIIRKTCLREKYGFLETNVYGRTV
jgi:hypothetical protein